MENQAQKNEELAERVLEMLAPMNDVMIRKEEDRICLCKGNVQFGFIKDEQVYMLGTTGDYNRLPLEKRKNNFLPDYFLTAATESWWIAVGKKPKEKY